MTTLGRRLDQVSLGESRPRTADFVKAWSNLTLSTCPYLAPHSCRTRARRLSGPRPEYGGLIMNGTLVQARLRSGDGAEAMYQPSVTSNVAGRKSWKLDPPTLASSLAEHPA